MNLSSISTPCPDAGLILACGGSGTRFGADQNKLLMEWRGLAQFCHPLRTFLPLLRPEQIVVAAPAELLPAFRAAMIAAGLPAGIQLIAGGGERRDSVALALAALPETVRFVAVQDGARPRTSAELLRECLESARSRGSGVAAHPVTDTIKVVDAAGRVLETPDRATLWAAETPQAFRRDWLEAGLTLAREQNRAVTDDAQAVELAGNPVWLVHSREPNPKITHPHDLALLETPG